MNVTIQRAALDDAEVVGAVTAMSWQAAYRGIVPEDTLSRVTPQSRTEKFKTVLPLLSDAEFYLVLADGQPAGVFNLHNCRDADASGCAEIGVFYFLPDYWGRGLGAQAMAFAFDRLRERGYEQVILWVLEENLRARRFYEKQGFMADGTSKVITLGRELTDIRYRRSLSCE
jgi:RimJ/RimL family protein N-acetyltransferase